MLQRAAQGVRQLRDGPSGVEVDHMRAWSISAQLAALPRHVEDQVPQSVRALIREAKQLHPAMVAGEDARSGSATQGLAAPR